MTASAVTLVDVTSREPGRRALTGPAVGARGRVMFVGISTALFGISGLQRRLGGTNLRLACRQMPVTAQHPYRLAAPRTMKCLEDARKESLAPPGPAGLSLNGVNAHR